MNYDETYDYDLDSYEYQQEMLLTLADQYDLNPFVLSDAEKLDLPDLPLAVRFAHSVNSL